MIPEWLRRHLEAIGQDNPDGITRAARVGRCAGCGRPVVRGLDGDLAAMPAVADVVEVDEWGEFLALATGRRTYALARYGGRWELNGRSLADLRAPPATAVVPAHRCGVPLPATSRPHLTAERAERAEPTDDQPPF